MYALCTKYCKDESEALIMLNDGFLKVFKNISSFRHDGSLEGWIRKIIFRSIADHFRIKSNQVRFILPEDNMPELIAQENASSALDIEDLIHIIEVLPAASAKVLLLYAIEGFSHKEIGQLLDISENTSKWHLSNARQILREKLSINPNYTPKSQLP